MKPALYVLFFSLSAGMLMAQPPAMPPVSPSLQTFASSADVAALLAKAKSEHKEGQAIVVEPILQFAPYTESLEYRPAAGPAAVHDKQSEMMYVVEGSGTLLTGGRLVGNTIQGGESRKISKGDFLVVPQGTPHQISAVDGSIVLVTIKVPGGGASAR